MENQHQVYKIRGLDCAEEVSALKGVLLPLVDDVGLLSFDVINGKLTVSVEADEIEASEVIRAVGRTGMEAIPWSVYIETRGEQEHFWSRHGRLLCCGFSGILLLSGFLLHGALHSWWDALGRQDEGHSYPFGVQIVYALSILSAYWFVAPKAWYAIRGFRADMNVLMTLACIGALAIGEWMEGATVAFLFSFALVLESWSVGRARRSISALLDGTPDVARAYCCHDKVFEERAVEDVSVGTLVQVRPGERIPLDGMVKEGESYVNQAPITGESVPVAKATGDEVYAGSVNGDGLLEITVTKTAEHSTLGRMMKMIEEAQSKRAGSEQWVEGFARVYTPVMMVLSVLVMVLVPLLSGGGVFSGVYQGLVLLVIACPCALVISTPISIVSGLSTAARNGVLIKGGKYLELPSRLKVCAIDKTGTLTEGRVAVQEIVALNNHTPEELLMRAASLEAHSDHPIASAILRAARDRDVPVEASTQFKIMPGKGAQGMYGDTEYWIGSHRFMHDRGVEEDFSHREAIRLEETGNTVVAIGNDTHVCGLFSVSDGVREDAGQMVRGSDALGLGRWVMLTGDNERTARAVGSAVGIADVRAELMPEEKVAAVVGLVEEWGAVAMIGDGINDAPAMAASSMGIAMGAVGSDAAIETADVALMSDDLSKIPWLIRHSKRTMRIIKQNIVFALGLKLIFVGLAFGGMATLWMAIAADMGASLLVIFNGLRLLGDTEG